MEAIAVYSYESEDPDVFSLNLNDRLVVLPLNEDWCRAKLNGSEAFAPLAYIDIKPHPWFMGSVGRGDTNLILLERDSNGDSLHPDGSFIIRNSSETPGNFSLSVKCKDIVKHFRIYYEDNKFKLWDEKFDSLNQLIHYHYSHSISQSKNIILKDMFDLTSSVSSNINDVATVKHLQAPRHQPPPPPLPPVPPPPPAFEYYVAKAAFNARDSNELSFKKGDRFRIIDKIYAEWWKAECNERVGLVPVTYLELA